MERDYSVLKVAFCDWFKEWNRPSYNEITGKANSKNISELFLRCRESSYWGESFGRVGLHGGHQGVIRGKLGKERDNAFGGHKKLLPILSLRNFSKLFLKILFICLFDVFSK